MGDKITQKNKKNNYYSVEGEHTYHLGALDFGTPQEEAIRLKKTLANQEIKDNFNKQLINPKYGKLKNEHASEAIFIQRVFPVLNQAVNRKMQQLGLGQDKGQVITHNLLAQMCHEGGWGRKTTGKFNYYGWKATKEDISKGKYTVAKTKEIINGKEQYINDEFVDYNNLEDSVNTYVNELFDDFKLGEYFKKGGAKTPEGIFKHLKNRNYYTADYKSYLKSIKGILNGKSLPRTRMQMRARGLAYEPVEPAQHSLVARKGAKLIKRRFK